MSAAAKPNILIIFGDDIGENVIANSLVGIGNPEFRAMLENRPGPLSHRLLKVIDEFQVHYPQAAP